MELSRRELGVLREVVRLYIQTGESVSSGDVAKASSLGLSAASIRHVMASLEERGLLSRAHASAGRVPTDSSLRLYVDSAPAGRRLSPWVRNRLAARLAAVQRELVEDLEWVAALVAEVTEEAGLAIRPIGEDPVLEAVSLVPLTSDRALGVLVTAGGSVEKRLVELDGSWSEAHLQEVATWLGRRFQGKSLGRALEELEAVVTVEVGDDGEETRLARDAASVARQLFVVDEDVLEVLVAGTEQLLQRADFERLERMRLLLGVLQDRRGIARVLRRSLDDARTRVIIGEESEMTASGGLGMVGTLFYRGGRRAGAVGVVGSRRMDYLRIVPVVEFVADSVTGMLDGAGADDE